MYIYPNGLKCNASETQVRLFEAIVPPLATIISLIGFFVALVVTTRLFHAITVQQSLESLILGLLAGLVWMGLCVLLAHRIFVAWCKPFD